MTWKDIYDYSERLLRRWVQTLEQEEGEGAPGNFSERIARQERYDAGQAYLRFRRSQRRIRLRWTAAAAVAACLVAVSVWLLGDREDEAAWVMPVAEVPDVQPIQPGSRKAVLTMADGSVWALRDSAMAVGKEQEWRVDDAGLQAVAPDTAAPALAYNTLEVPRGGEFYLTLPDGTQVWLNSASVLRFPTQFAGGMREVQLEGEAYFDVTHVEGSPFRVVMDEGAISVLGTEFCATSYPDEPMAATLVEGRIAFEAQDGTARELQPSQRLEYDRTTGGMQVEEVDTWLYTSWREDVFCFENRSLGDILAVLSRWYDVQVVFTDNALKEVRLSGTLEKYSAIEPFLRLFEAGADVEFKVSGRQITVAKRK